MGSWHGAARARVDFLWILDLYRQGKIKLDEFDIRAFARWTRSMRRSKIWFRGKVARTVLVF